jgi:hypothetical protein
MARHQKSIRRSARILKETTGWSYTFCLHVTSRVGAENVLKCIADSFDNASLAVKLQSQSDGLTVLPTKPTSFPNGEHE